MKIKSCTIKHEGLRNFALTGDVSGINSRHANRLNFILTVLKDMRFPNSIKRLGNSCHPIFRTHKRCYAVHVNRNWRVIFEFSKNGYPTNLDYVDYH